MRKWICKLIERKLITETNFELLGMRYTLRDFYLHGDEHIQIPVMNVPNHIHAKVRRLISALIEHRANVSDMIINSALPSMPRIAFLRRINDGEIYRIENLKVHKHYTSLDLDAEDKIIGVTFKCVDTEVYRELITITFDRPIDRAGAIELVGDAVEVVKYIHPYGWVNLYRHIRDHT